MSPFAVYTFIGSKLTGPFRHLRMIILESEKKKQEKLEKLMSQLETRESGRQKGFSGFERCKN